ncbi:MAG TPA: hypothetical protein DIT90_07615 [Dehalococcoidia bacterium]|mgnify:CR=1 FL=1|nr:hypothetical protein [Chloroflexota bacterium]HCP23972.1 hypothetical protein [Dehalococcoidia bacterium]
MDIRPDLERICMAANRVAALVEERLPDNESALVQMELEPTFASREEAGKWLSDRILAPSQQQRG